MDLLIELGADVNDDANGRGTPLHRAAAVGNISTAQALLNHGARADASNRSGQNPLTFALQRCGNATIQSMAPMAEFLLGAMRDVPTKPRSFISRVLGGGAKHASPVTPEMQTLVQKIGINFEFHRSAYNSESVDTVATHNSLRPLQFFGGFCQRIDRGSARDHPACERSAHFFRMRGEKVEQRRHGSVRRARQDHLRQFFRSRGG